MIPAKIPVLLTAVPVPVPVPAPLLLTFLKSRSKNRSTMKNISLHSECFFSTDFAVYMALSVS